MPDLRQKPMQRQDRRKIDVKYIFSYPGQLVTKVMLNRIPIHFICLGICTFKTVLE